MTTLRARLEAGEQSRELDCRIANALGWTDKNGPAPSPEELAGLTPARLKSYTHGVPAFTTSLDALRAATPEGWRLSNVTPHHHTDGRRYDLTLEGPEGAWAGGRSRTLEGAWALAILQAAGKGGER